MFTFLNNINITIIFFLSTSGLYSFLFTAIIAKPELIDAFFGKLQQIGIPAQNGIFVSGDDDLSR